jgi:hypothetical protein
MYPATEGKAPTLFGAFSLLQARRGGARMRVRIQRTLHDPVDRVQGGGHPCPTLGDSVVAMKIGRRWPMRGSLMARKLKTYQTSLGFFEQAIAAPSMKAAWRHGAPPAICFIRVRRRRALIRRRCRDHEEAGRRSQASRAIRRALQRTPELPKNLGQDGRKKLAHKPSTNCPPGRTGQGGGPKGGSSVRTGAPASRAPGSQGGGGQAGR